ncbi:hypothetical protein MJG53_016534 [Ovis ammon polii x Ovis aries]|uniref:Uncharacterized protein n=1 Tax=Ovis ammon polii x Ovis aries TaxID=2918886 RepID=A0ACB9UBL7_9CETA|nr:hypothetical protein MJT46_016225 [Ovis ammon polii x Ovis aries]KAI4563960.1 hypothetical protein MJG53_016534 [Ovis ammon polii x Ovis aries]
MRGPRSVTGEHPLLTDTRESQAQQQRSSAAKRMIGAHKASPLCCEMLWMKMQRKTFLKPQGEIKEDRHVSSHAVTYCDEFHIEPRSQDGFSLMMKAGELSICLLFGKGMPEQKVDFKKSDKVHKFWLFKGLISFGRKHDESDSPSALSTHQDGSVPHESVLNPHPRLSVMIFNVFLEMIPLEMIIVMVHVASKTEKQGSRSQVNP